jgi:hypothetical protein
MSGNGRSIVVCAVIASALSWPLPAAADEAAPARSDIQYLGLKGRILSDEEMSDMRGGFIRGNRATITVDDQVATDYDPNVPGSASVTVNLGPNTVSRASASTTGTSGYASAMVTITGVTFGGSALNALGTTSMRRAR